MKIFHERKKNVAGEFIFFRFPANALKRFNTYNP